MLSTYVKWEREKALNIIVFKSLLKTHYNTYCKHIGALHIHIYVHNAKDLHYISDLIYFCQKEPPNKFLVIVPSNVPSAGLRNLFS